MQINMWLTECCATVVQCTCHSETSRKWPFKKKKQTATTIVSMMMHTIQVMAERIKKLGSSNLWIGMNLYQDAHCFCWCITRTHVLFKKFEVFVIMPFSFFFHQLTTHKNRNWWNTQRPTSTNPTSKQDTPNTGEQHAAPSGWPPASCPSQEDSPTSQWVIIKC